MIDLEERELFGSGIKILVPKDFKDVSDFRQVPDHQEVFVSNDSDATLIVELLESPSEPSDYELGINFHWNELCQETGSNESVIEQSGKLDIGEFTDVPFIIGNQQIPKFGKVNDTNRDDFKKQKILDEARKAGKAPALLDEEGQVINPHIPEYIVKAPWYINTGGPSLKHQRAPNPVETSSTACQIKGILETEQVATKFRKGACENCGALTHKTKECVDRPRKVGAKYSGIDLKPDEFLVEGPQDFDGKRDRWASYDPKEYDEVVKTYESIEEERRKFKESEAEADLKKGISVEGKEEEDLKNEEEKYADAVDMPGQKVDAKARMTVRNLRIREDTAKYLRNLDIDSAHYDPKTRSMRENPNQEEDPDKLTYAGDNFVRTSGESSKLTELQVFAWQAYERGEDISLQANPSEVERLYREHTKQKEQEKRKLEESLLKRYGDDVLEDGGNADICEESDVYIEYSKTGKVVKTKHNTMRNYLSIDIGTTSTKAFLYSETKLLASSQYETTLLTLNNGHVEQDPEELFQSVLNCISQLQTISDNEQYAFPVACGITNQRESIVAFRKSSGKPVSNAISWMDVRTSGLVEALKKDSHNLVKFERLTSLKASTYFSAFKIKWILDNVDFGEDLEDLAFATIDTWILWKLTGGSSFYTDLSNASRTFLVDLNAAKWSPEILKYFGIKEAWLPEIINYECDYGAISCEFPFAGLSIKALIGDQQSSLIGHWGSSFEEKTKCTFGTGAFLLKSLRCNDNSTKVNALRTAIFPGYFAAEYPIVCAGSLVKWLQNNLNFISSPKDLDSMGLISKSAESCVYFVPDLAGCLYPTWDPSARGSFHNISLQTDKYDMIVAVMESIAFCIRRALENENVSVLSVDGGMCKNRHFCQLLANICQCSIRVLDNANATGLGAAVVASNFTMNIEHEYEIIQAQPDLKLIYDNKYRIWSNLK